MLKGILKQADLTKNQSCILIFRPDIVQQTLMLKQ